MFLKQSLASGVAALALALPAAAADTVAIVNARILPMGGAAAIARGVVLIRDGKVAALGADVAIPADARRIDAAGATATPGFMLMGNEAGAIRFPGTPGYDDSTPSGDLTAGFDIQYAVDPDDLYLPEIRRGGSTLVLSTPGAYGPPRPYSYFGGKAAILHLGVGGPLVLKPGVVETLRMGPAVIAGGRGVQMQQLRRVFGLLKAASGGAPPSLPGLSSDDVAALREVAAGRLPLLVAASAQVDIEHALDLAREFGLRIILDDPDEGWRMAGEIAAAKVPVLVRPEADAPGEVARTMANAARLDAAGVKVAIALSGNAGVFKHASSRYYAGIAVANGMAYDRALEALTSVPAELFGLDDRFGTLAPGKQADIVLWTGDPLEPATQVRTVMIDGVEQPLVSRKTILRDKYMLKVLGLRPPAP